MSARRTLTLEAFQFMLGHAGYGYDPATETPDQGRVRCALALARAEHALAASPSSVGWVDDPDADTSFLHQDDWEEDLAAYERGEFVFMGAILRDVDGEHIQSLWGIHLARDWRADPYRRVVEAELAHEAGHAIDPAYEASERAYWLDRGVQTV